MGVNDSILLKNIFFHLIFSLFFIYTSICFIGNLNPFNYKKIVTTNIFIKIFSRVIMPIVLFSASLWFSDEIILDYTLKDYQSGKGVIEGINNPYRDFNSELLIVGKDGSYSIPRELLKGLDKGQIVQFVYGKRSEIIFEINKVKK
ncbi:hypothetical protein [Neobacillus ginsengisoli]|uniref:Uncharacterized protein n=1 Tax=Neobacillus ginsengisoli TaxID=904295 RepID=A0ABT9XY63_9BACI|nr:hypothetical protein [Neobacillus ginsengisoli]MDQ0200311.1 hypothetical protein [Neobacillus ginsengisoli]